MNNKILVTGANGLLGRYILSSFLLHDYEVYALVQSIPRNTNPDIKYIEVDLNSDWSYDDLPSNIDVIIHLAQSSKFREFPNYGMDVFNVNIKSTIKLLDYSTKIKLRHFIYASSGGIYSSGIGNLKENARINDPGKLGMYLGSKMCGEILTHSYSKIINMSIIRPFFIYGKYQNSSMLIPRLFKNVLNGNEIILNGDHGIKINPIHAEDAAAAILNIVNKKLFMTFNLAGNEILSIKDIANFFGKYLNMKPIFKVSNEKQFDLIADNSLMKKFLCSPQKDFKKSISDIEKYIEK